MQLKINNRKDLEHILDHVLELLWSAIYPRYRVGMN